MPQTDGGSEWQQWFERVWEDREEVLYPSLFGEIRIGIFPIQAEVITGVFKQESFDPRWLHHGVFEFAPTASRNSWLYVTSGMSNDWEADAPDATTPSGLGCEFVFETTRQSKWAIQRLLHLMTYQILLCHGRYSAKPLSDFDRIPLGEPLCPGGSLLNYFMLAPPTRFPRRAHLESGPFDFFQIVGVSAGEAAYARSNGGSALLEILTADGHFPVTDPDRTCLKRLG
ncbi:MAG TPA: suppressor of fused domain protein [Verrucomicrobiae bacterium]|nr:suppressor of fused domain protein [Verrucomicrobiae bacterium]